MPGILKDRTRQAAKPRLGEGSHASRRQRPGPQRALRLFPRRCARSAGQRRSSWRTFPACGTTSASTWRCASPRTPSGAASTSTTCATSCSTPRGTECRKSGGAIFFVGLRSDLGPHAVPTAPLRTHEVEEEFPEGTALPDDPRMLWGRQIPRADRPLARGHRPRGPGRPPEAHRSPVTGRNRWSMRLPLRRKPSCLGRRAPRLAGPTCRGYC